jgi:hypothetical protein
VRVCAGLCVWVGGWVDGQKKADPLPYFFCRPRRDLLSLPPPSPLPPPHQMSIKLSTAAFYMTISSFPEMAPSCVFNSCQEHQASTSTRRVTIRIAEEWEEEEQEEEEEEQEEAVYKPYTCTC